MRTKITARIRDVQPVDEIGWLVSVSDPAYLEGFPEFAFLSLEEIPAGLGEPQVGDQVELLTAKILTIKRLTGESPAGGSVRHGGE